MSHALSPEHCDFITREVSISLASRDVRLVPSVSRVMGCRVSADRREVTVLVDGASNAQLLADIRSTACVAAVFSLPSTHQTLQIKSRSARISELMPSDAALAAAHRDAFTRHLVALEYPYSFAFALHSSAPEALVAVSFSVDDIFEQTPGPAAGVRMET